MTSLQKPGIALAFVVVCIIGGVIMVGRLISADTSIVPESGNPALLQQAESSPTQSSSIVVLEAESLIRANERLLEMTKWTIGLVITVGGLLVGYSWFQNASSLARDEKLLSDYKEEMNAELSTSLARVKEAAESLTVFESRLQTLESSSTNTARISNKPSLASVLDYPPELRMGIITTEMDDAGSKGDVQALLQWSIAGLKSISAEDSHEFHTDFSAINQTFAWSSAQAIAHGRKPISSSVFATISDEDLHATLVDRANDYLQQAWITNLRKLKYGYVKHETYELMEARDVWQTPSPKESNDSGELPF